MGDLYRSVRELPESVLDYLRWCLYYGAGDSVWYDDANDEVKDAIDAAERCEDITTELIFAAYEGIHFVPEDFAFGAGDDWSMV